MSHLSRFCELTYLYSRRNIVLFLISLIFAFSLWVVLSFPITLLWTVQKPPALNELIGVNDNTYGAAPEDRTRIFYRLLVAYGASVVLNILFFLLLGFCVSRSHGSLPVDLRQSGRTSVRGAQPEGEVGVPEDNLIHPSESDAGTERGSGGHERRKCKRMRDLCLLLLFCCVTGGLTVVVALVLLVFMLPCALSRGLRPNGPLCLTGGEEIASNFCTAAPASSSCSLSTPPKVIVIGAGISGAAAARDLAAAGVEVTVVEARSRTGGRIWSVQEGGVDLELGAGWIHDVQCNPMDPLLSCGGVLKESLGNRGAEESYVWVWRDESRRRGEFVEFPRYDFCADDLVSEALENHPERDATLRVGDAIGEVLEEELEEGRMTETEREECERVARGVSSLDETGWDRMPLEYWRPGAEGWRPFNFATGYLQKHILDDFVVVGGYGKTVEFLLQQARDAGPSFNLYLDTKALSVKSGVDTVQVEVESLVGGHKDGMRALEADAVVVSVPLGVLQRGEVVFDPPLSPSKREAMGRLQMGILDRVWLAFDRPWWEDAERRVHQLGPLFNGTANLLLPAKGKRSPHDREAGKLRTGAGSRDFFHAVVLAGGEGSDLIETLEDDVLIPRVMSEIRGLVEDSHLFPAPSGSSRSLVPDPSDHKIIRWGKDPFSGGSYSMYSVEGGGGSHLDNRALGEPEETAQRFWAGEATMESIFQTTHGALISGRRAAKQALDFLCKGKEDLQEDTTTIKGALLRKSAA